MDDAEWGWMFVYVCVGLLVLMYIAFGNTINFDSLGVSGGLSKITGALGNG